MWLGKKGEKRMPTISQLVRSGRQSKTTKSKSPYLGVGYNSLKKKETRQVSPQKRGVCESCNYDT